MYYSLDESMTSVVFSDTLAARGLEERKNDQFYVTYCVTLANVLYFEECLIHDSRQFTNLLGLCHFLLNT
jgi:hypothetical protein